MVVVGVGYSLAAMPVAGLPCHPRAAMTYVELDCIGYDTKSLGHPSILAILARHASRQEMEIVRSMIEGPSDCVDVIFLVTCSATEVPDLGKMFFARRKSPRA